MTTVAYKGWDNVLTTWNTGTWDGEQSIDNAATASVGQAVLEGDAIVNVTGVSGTATLNDVFSTNNGLGSTGSIGTISLSIGTSFSVTGVSSTASVSDVFTTNTNTAVQMTASVNSATVSVTGTATVTVTGVSGTASVGNLKTIWGTIIPSQTPNYSTISPSQSPSWTDIAA